MFDRDQIVQEYILGFSSPDNMDLLLNDSVILLHRLYSKDTEIISILNHYNNNTTFEEDTPILSDLTFIYPTNNHNQYCNLLKEIKYIDSLLYLISLLVFLTNNLITPFTNWF